MALCRAKRYHLLFFPENRAGNFFRVQNEWPNSAEISLNCLFRKDRHAMEAGQKAIYRFDRFTLDLVRGMLLAEDGTELSLRPKSFALLHHFVANSGRLVDRDELMQVVWPGVFVSDDSIAQCITEIRRALGGDGQRLLRTIPRRGYRLAVPTSIESAPEVRATPEDATTPGPAPLVAAILSDPPMIAVLPFQNMSGDPDQEYFADGMVKEIITALSRIRWLFVIARNSSFIYKGHAVDIKQVGRELGVRYVLEGSVRRSADQVRVTAQLIDASNGAHLWAEHFDGPLADVFELQDKIASSVAGIIEPALQDAETTRSADRPKRDLAAYDLYLRGYALALSSASRFRDALDLLEEACLAIASRRRFDGIFARCHALFRELNEQNRLRELDPLLARDIGVAVGCDWRPDGSPVRLNPLLTPRVTFRQAAERFGDPGGIERL
jgi:TolB-like protein